jgi:CRISPR-associated protein Cpf1
MDMEGVTNMNNISDFCGYKSGYPVSKTLRFELKPQGKTLEHIEQDGLLTTDKKKAADYQDVKKIIDNYHKYFIDDVLRSAKFDWKPLAQALKAFHADKMVRKNLEDKQEDMRKQIVKLFTEDKRFGSLTGSTPKAIFSELLPDYFLAKADSPMNKEALETFKSFSTYFTGFQENRKNVYSSEPIPTAVPYRIVHDNFPKFFQNLETYVSLSKHCPSVLSSAEEELSVILHGKKLSVLFTIDSFNDCITQKGIDFYNQIIGGISGTAGEKKVRGINEFVNLYWQQHPDFAKENRKVKMVPLFKQILSDRSTLSFVIDSIAADEELQNALQKFHDTLESGVVENGEKSSVREISEKLFTDISKYPADHIFIDAKELSFVSQVLFGSWSILGARMEKYSLAIIRSKTAQSKWLKSSEFSFKELDDVLAFVSDECPATDVRMPDYFTRRYRIQFDESQDKFIHTSEILFPSFSELLEDNNQKWTAVEILFEQKDVSNPFRENVKSVETIKAYLDSLQDMLHRIKPLKASPDAEKDAVFYDDFEKLYQIFYEGIPLYNKIRNYLTKKVLDPGKYKLNFDNPTLADGWDFNKETANACVILIKDDNYYLGVMNAKHKPDFCSVKASGTEPCYRKMVYKLLPGPNKMLPKVFFSTKGIASFNPPEEILKGYENGKHKKGDNFDIDYCHILIDYFKSAINQHHDWKNFGFTFSDTRNYTDISNFYKEIAEQGYKITFTDISESMIDTWVEEDKLYLFQIYNKDFAPGTTGNPNLHTLYWKNLFSEENLRDVVLKLNGQAELFYRETGIKKPVVHKTGERMVNRTTKDGMPLTEPVHSELFKYENNKLEGALSADARLLLDDKQVVVKVVVHDIIKDRRYTEPKFLFHVPLTINFKAAEQNAKTLNLRVRHFLKNNAGINIIGLDRGERNLIDLCLIDRNGKIIKQKSFNVINKLRNDGKTVAVDYQEKLDQREKERGQARKSWQEIGKIAELKEGYLSAVVHEIAELMVQQNAVVVMEDLNFGFKRGRFHVEKQVYQKFEQMLINKLNYLVFKDKRPSEPGGILNGYQLTEEFESFQQLGKQSGFLFYIPAGYTSKIDPETGFVNLFDLKNLTNVEKKREFFSKFKSIRYDSNMDSFAFSFDYKDFGGKASEEMCRTEWTVYSWDKRIKYDSALKKYKDIHPTKELENLFSQYSISWNGGDELYDAVMELGADGTSLKERRTIQFYDELYRMFILTIQMRNSNAETGEDYIISPVKDISGRVFDSREQFNLGDAATLPQDADANGAYHIALKGLYLLRQFDNTPDDQLKKVDLRIANKDWFTFRQQQ